MLKAGQGQWTSIFGTSKLRPPSKIRLLGFFWILKTATPVEDSAPWVSWEPQKCDPCERALSKSALFGFLGNLKSATPVEDSAPWAPYKKFEGFQNNSKVFKTWDFNPPSFITPQEGSVRGSPLRGIKIVFFIRHLHTRINVFLEHPKNTFLAPRKEF